MLMDDMRWSLGYVQGLEDILVDVMRWMDERRWILT